jgi:hypothetical protein
MQGDDEEGEVVHSEVWQSSIGMQATFSPVAFVHLKYYK